MSEEKKDVKKTEAAEKKSISASEAKKIASEILETRGVGGVLANETPLNVSMSESLTRKPKKPK